MYTPSQAMTRNSSSPNGPSALYSMISGFAVIACSSGGKSAFFLNSKSPIALDSARFPIKALLSATAPELMHHVVTRTINAPVLNPATGSHDSIQFRCPRIKKSEGVRRKKCSLLFKGLWSILRGFESPPTHSIARESPALAW